MQKIEITKVVKSRLLVEQLFAAFPEWKYINWRGVDATDVSVTKNEVYFPVETNPLAVQAIIDAHDPSVKSVGELDEDAEAGEKTEFNNRPDWLKNITFNELEAYVLNNTVGNTTEEQALAIVDVATNLADIKAILRNVIKAIYGLVRVNIRISRVVLVLIRYLARRFR